MRRCSSEVRASCASSTRSLRVPRGEAMRERLRPSVLAAPVTLAVTLVCSPAIARPARTYPSTQRPRRPEAGSVRDRQRWVSLRPALTEGAHPPRHRVGVRHPQAPDANGGSSRQDTPWSRPADRAATAGAHPRHVPQLPPWASTAGAGRLRRTLNPHQASRTLTRSARSLPADSAVSAPVR